MKLLLAAILAALCVLLVDSAVVGGEFKFDYPVQIRILNEEIAKRCPGMMTPGKKIPTDLQTQEQVYNQLIEKLGECLKLTLTTEKEIPTTTPTTVQPVTSTSGQPIECQQAVNYTQSWRRDHVGSVIRPGGPNSYKGWACDMHISNTEWFRFAGAAGNRMLDTCPKGYSCGTGLPYWTDAAMPKAVGIVSTVEVYGVVSSMCKFYHYAEHVKVMRCSNDTDHDFIYKQTTNHTGDCQYAFCGMI